MTQLDVTYTFATAPSEASAIALANIREVYGVRQLKVDERAKTVIIEYDATRLTEPVIAQLLRRAGLQVTLKPSAGVVVTEAATA